MFYLIGVMYYALVMYKNLSLILSGVVLFFIVLTFCIENNKEALRTRAHMERGKFLGENVFCPVVYTYFALACATGLVRLFL